MNVAVKSAQYIGLCAMVAVLGCPTAGWGQADGGKSAEEILNGLLDSRGIGGVRHDKRPGEKTEEPRIAVPILFKYNSAEITPESYDQLRRIADALKDSRLSSAQIRVEGHTDNQGADEYNLSLSERRAQAVRRYLIQDEGISAARLDAKGYGKTRPLPNVSQDTDEGRAENRRVELVNLGTATAKAAEPPPNVEPAVADASGKLSVNVLVNYRRRGQSKVLAPGAVLTQDDNYRITFTPNRDSFVYVYQIDPNGDATVVFPNQDYSSASNPVKARQAQALPGSSKWLSLDGVRGDREIIVLASESEMADAKETALNMRGQGFSTTTRGIAGIRTEKVVSKTANIFAFRLPFKQQ